MKKKNSFVQIAVSAVLCVAAAILPMAASAATYYVSPDGNDDDNDGKSWAKPFATIQKAMSSANAWGGSIWISNGTYKIESELVPSSEGLTIRSFSGNPSDVTIDAQGLCRCFNRNGLYSHYFRGITFINGNATGNGGGVLVGDYSTFDDCVFSNCTATAQGGAIYVSWLGHMTNVRFEGCSAGTNGGGLYGYGFRSNCYISGVTVTNCTAGSNGGGIYAKDGDNGDRWLPSMTNSVIRGCRATLKGGGLYIKTIGCVNDCDISGNVADGLGGGGICALGGAVIRNCTLSGNECRYPAGIEQPAGGSAIRLDGIGVIDGCHIEGNTFENDLTLYCHGGSAVWLSSDSSLVNSAVIGNSGSRSVGLQWNSAGGVLVSNCLFKSNVARANARGGILALYGLKADSLITDCRFIDNQAAKHGGLVEMTLNSGSKNSTLRIRNCLMSGNVQASGSGLVWATSATNATANRIVLENCTIVSNTVSSGPVIEPYIENANYTATNFFSVSGCAILFNNGKAAFNNNYKASANVTYNCTELSGMSESNIKYDSSKPLFADLENGDFRPATGSQLRDVVPAAAWMGDGSKHSKSRDLGTGYEIRPAGTYGVDVVWTDTMPRLYGSAADIGCMEYWVPRGITITIK